MKKTAKLGLIIFCLAVFFTLSAFAPSANNRNADSENAKIKLYYSDISVEYTDKFLKPTDHTVAEEIHKRKINAPFDEKMSMVDTCVYAGADYKTALLYSFPMLEKMVAKMVSKVNVEPKDSEITFSPDSYPMFTITRERSGLEVSEFAIYQGIYFALRRNRNISLKINPRVLEPTITSADNVKLTGLRARFATDYSLSSDNRKHNIRLSLQKINGTVVKPDEEFSFNGKVGKRSEKNGYKTGKIIKAGEYIDGTGGGVCQTSTTLYNCALLADMEITSVRNHSLEPSYVLPSFDAMVNSGSSDLKFKNNGDRPVFIRSYGNDTTAVVEIYGSRLPYRIVRKSDVISREEPPGDVEKVDTDGKYFQPEDNASTGTRKRVWFSKGEMKSEGYLLYYNHSGHLVDKKHIRTDKYNRTKGLIAIAP